MAKDKKKIKAEEMDLCVYCGRLSEEKKSTPINLRKYYIEGAGQLCKKCYEYIYS